MGKPITCFEDIDAWQLGMELAERIYTLSDSPKLNGDRRLSDQIHGAAISIPSNIAEGYERRSNPELSRFLSFTRGSCGELRTQLMLAKRISYVPPETADDLIRLTRRVSAAAGRLRASITPKPR